jgi:cytoskeletal protein CcmA (bactofilin family)
MPRLVRIVIAALALLLALMLVAGMTMGKDLLGGKLRTDRTVVLPAGEHVTGDLYLLGGTVTVDGTVDGDLVAMGGQVQLNGSVGGDLLAAGGTVVLDGSVAGDARIAAGQLTVNGKVGKDLALAVGEATLSSQGTVGGDVIVAAGQASVSGSVAGSVEGSAGTYAQSGTVGGTVDVTVGQAAQPVQPRTAADAIGDAIRHFVVVLLFGALGLWLLPRAMRAAEALVRRRTFPALGFGLLGCAVYVVGAIALVLLVILLAILFGVLTLGSLSAIVFFAGLLALGVATFGLLLVTSYIADGVVGLAIASLVAPATGGGRWGEFGLLAIGSALVVAVTSIPVVGWVFKLAVVLIGLGAIVLAAWNARRSRSAPAASAPEEIAAGI